MLIAQALALVDRALDTARQRPRGDLAEVEALFVELGR